MFMTACCVALACWIAILILTLPSRYTASRLPVDLELAIPMSDRTAARREEARIKRLSRAGKLALLDAAR